MKKSGRFLSIVLAALATFGSTSCAQPTLQVSYSEHGIERLAFGSVVLEDLNKNPADAFHIWHMKSTDMTGKVLTQGQYGWGETNNGKTWDAQNQTMTYKFVWGSIRVAFSQKGNTLDLSVTTTNAADSGIIFEGATIYPLVLHFPRTPSGFADPPVAQITLNANAPGVTLADYDRGEVAAVVPDAEKPVYSGFLPAGSPGAYTPLLSTTTPDGAPVFLTRSDRPLLPGHSDVQTLSLRFARSSTPVTALADDAYRNWGKAWPPQVQWTDRRVIGTVYLASSPQGDPSQPAGYSNNPRRYFNDSNPLDFDIRTEAGRAAFANRVLRQATANVENLRKLNAQGAITWDIEGEEYPQSTSYACAPDQIAQLAPEMESVIAQPGSPYVGMKLADAYFKIMRDAGFKVGVCVRPQHFTFGPGARAQQVNLSEPEVVLELLRKMKYAHDRWGATLFYIDSSVDANGAALNPEILQKVGAQMPDSLLIPEEYTPRAYAYAAPFETFLFHTDLGIDAPVYHSYPHAFSVNLINDVDSAKLAKFTPELTQSVRRGDILMVHADYWHPNNTAVIEIYKAAAGK